MKILWGCEPDLYVFAKSIFMGRSSSDLINDVSLLTILQFLFMRWMCCLFFHFSQIPAILHALQRGNFIHLSPTPRIHSLAQSIRNQTTSAHSFNLFRQFFWSRFSDNLSVLDNWPTVELKISHHCIELLNSKIGS